MLQSGPHTNSPARMTRFLLPAILMSLIAQAESAPPLPDAAVSAAPGAHLDYTPGKSPKFWSIATAETIMARWPDFSKAYYSSWSYVNGYVSCGLDMLYRSTGDRSYFDYIKRYMDEFIDENGSFRGV